MNSSFVGNTCLPEAKGFLVQRRVNCWWRVRLPLLCTEEHAQPEMRKSKAFVDPDCCLPVTYAHQCLVEPNYLDASGNPRAIALCKQGLGVLGSHRGQRAYGIVLDSEAGSMGYDVMHLISACSIEMPLNTLPGAYDEGC